MKNRKGFTLIELLAVIIILGVIMLIAIPSVTRYINDSRKDTYIDTARQIVKGAIPMVNGGELDVYDTNTTYYIPASCIPTENSMSSPFGEFVDAYVIVGYTGEGYEYYWASVDTAHQGIEMKEYNKLTKSDVKPNIDSVDTTKGIGSRTNIKILEEGECRYFVEDTSSGSGNSVTTHSLAKDVLLIDTNSEQKTPYVLCPVKNGQEIFCRVLYDKTSQFGLQLVSANPVATVILGSGDPKVSGTGATRAQNSYMRAITTLNEAALEFKDDNGISIDVRSIGSKPTDKNYPDYLTGTARSNLYWTTGSTSYEYYIATYRNKFFERDENYVDDEEQLKLLGIYGFEDSSISSTYWMASRTRGIVKYTSGSTGKSTILGVRFGIMEIDNTGYYGYPYDYLFLRDGTNTSYQELYYSYEKGLRPVFIIADNVQIERGNGTKESPYVLGLGN